MSDSPRRLHPAAPGVSDNRVGVDILDLGGADRTRSVLVQSGSGWDWFTTASPWLSERSVAATTGDPASALAYGTGFVVTVGPSWLSTRWTFSLAHEFAHRHLRTSEVSDDPWFGHGRFVAATALAASASDHGIGLSAMASTGQQEAAGPPSHLSRWRAEDPGFFEPVRQHRRDTFEPVYVNDCVVGDDLTAVLNLARLLFALTKHRFSVVDTLSFLAFVLTRALRTASLLHPSPAPVKPPGRLVTRARRAPRGPDRVQAPMVLPGCGALAVV